MSGPALNTGDIELISCTLFNLNKRDKPGEVSWGIKLFIILVIRLIGFRAFKQEANRV